MPAVAPISSLIRSSPGHALKETIRQARMFGQARRRFRVSLQAWRIVSFKWVKLVNLLLREFLAQNRSDHFTTDVCEAMLSPLVFEGQAGVVDPHAVQKRRMQVVHMDRVADDVVAKVVGLAVADTGPDATTR